MPDPRPADWPVLEGLITTLAPSGTGASLTARVNVAPMGPAVAPNFEKMLLRPFQEGTTFTHLAATGEAVFHVVDEGALFARGVLGRLAPGPALPVRPAREVEGAILETACHAFELRERRRDTSEARALFEMDVLARHVHRPYFGPNRAAHALLEAAILVSRLHLTGPGPVLEAFPEFETRIAKTGTPADRAAMAELRRHVERHDPATPDPDS